MRFRLSLKRKDENTIIPINYQYPLSSAIYKILSKGDGEYSQFLHERGYGKGHKLFTFSDLKIRYRRTADRMYILDDIIELSVCFHLPEASQTFIEGLFRSETIVIADKISRGEFYVQSIISEKSPLNNVSDSHELIQITVRPESALVIGTKIDNGNYNFRSPDEEEFITSLIYSWREKIKSAYNNTEASEAMLLAHVEFYKEPYRSRLIHIKDGTNQKTTIKGYLNFKLKLTAEKRYIDLALNAGLGLYSAQGMGCMGVIKTKFNSKNYYTN